MKDIFDLTGRTALITGGSKGLGFAIASCFAARGASVAIASRNQRELDDAAGRISASSGHTVACVVADLTSREQVESLALSAQELLGHVDIFVNNAGSNIPEAAEEIHDDSWDEILQLNLTSGMALTRALAPGMRERNWGRIIHLSSVVAFAATPCRSVYAATKAGVIGMARVQALELRGTGVTVNCIAPGPFLTDLPKAKLTDGQKKAFAQRTILERWGEPDEIAGPALLLASDAGSYMTGSVLLVDGGIMSNLL